jgi:hypothetical protein
MAKKALPSNVNVRSPEAIRRVFQFVRSGQFRNYSEAAETLIIEASERRRYDAEQQKKPKTA